MALVNQLGGCGQCGAELCTVGDEIRCSACGLPHPDHPLAATARPAPPPAPIDVAAAFDGCGDGDNIDPGFGVAVVNGRIQRRQHARA